MGFRIGAGLGPFSVSARIGGGGGGSGGGGEFFPIILIIAVLSAITAGGSLVDNLGYWAVFNLLPMILLWVLAFNAIPYFPKKQSITRSNLFLSSALSPLIYFIFMQKVPLIDRAYESLSGPEKQKLYGSSLVDLAPFYYWVIAIFGPLVFIFMISLLQLLITRSALVIEQTERDKRRVKPAPSNNALLNERDKRRADGANNKPLSAAHLRHLKGFRKDDGKQEALKKLKSSFEQLGVHVQLVLNPTTEQQPSEQVLRLHFLRAELATSEWQRFDRLKSKKYREILLSLAQDVEAKTSLKALLTQPTDQLP